MMAETIKGNVATPVYTRMLPCARVHMRTCTYNLHTLVYTCIILTTLVQCTCIHVLIMHAYTLAYILNNFSNTFVLVLCTYLHLDTFENTRAQLYELVYTCIHLSVCMRLHTLHDFCIQCLGLSS